MILKSLILLDLPMPITTKRLTLRPVMPREGLRVFEAVDESREFLKEWLPWVESVKAWEDSEKTVRNFYAEFILRIALHCGIFYENRFVGMCGFHGINWTIPSAAIGYWCRTFQKSHSHCRG